MLFTIQGDIVKGLVLSSRQFKTQIILSIMFWKLQIFTFVKFKQLFQTIEIMKMVVDYFSGDCLTVGALALCML